MCGVVGNDQSKIELLCRLPLFATLTDEELADVAAVAEAVHFTSGETVLKEGDYSNSCYVIVAGHASAVREHRDGRAITLARFGPGDLFGELAMLDDQRRSATIKALDELEVVAIGGPAMLRLLREHPGIAVKMITTLAQKLRQTNERLAGQSFQTVQSRVAKALSALVEAARVEGTTEADVVIRTTQAELARLAGSSRESASRFLAVLERAGIITQGRGRLTVHEPAALERYVY
jgi:CRP/FNR family transcriptional regulator